MTDKQIDINNQVEVGLNIAKELLELHKMFEDEVEKNPYVIQTDFIKYKLFYFYQRADWLNVCFNLLDKQLKVKEQECEELKAMQKDLSFENQKFCYQIEEQTKQLEPFKDEYFKGLDNVVIAELAKKSIRITAENRKLDKTLTEIKEIAEKCCINQATLDCENYDDCTQCGRISDGEGIQQILQKISEVENG